MYPEPLGFIFGAHVVLPRDFGLLTVVSKSFGEEWIQPLRVLFFERVEDNHSRAISIFVIRWFSSVSKVILFTIQCD